MSILFASIFCRELKRLAKKDPSLPRETLRVALSWTQETALQGTLVSESKTQKARLLKSRIGSASRKKGKSGGYRVYYGLVGEQVLLLRMFSKAKVEDLPKSEVDRLKAACVAESFASIAEQWRTVDEFREFFDMVS